MLLETYPRIPLTIPILTDILKEYKRPLDKISELAKAGALIPIRRGLYMATPQYNLPLDHSEMILLANKVLEPSYISLDTALCDCGLTSKHSPALSSVTTKSSRKYTNVLGSFTYTHLPKPYYELGIKEENFNKNNKMLIASKEKALCDKIITTPGVQLRSEQQTWDYLTQTLRIQRYELSGLDHTQISQWLPYAPKKSSLTALVKTLRGFGNRSFRP